MAFLVGGMAPRLGVVGRSRGLAAVGRTRIVVAVVVVVVVRRGSPSGGLAGSMLLKGPGLLVVGVGGRPVVARWLGVCWTWRVVLVVVDFGLVVFYCLVFVVVSVLSM